VIQSVQGCQLKLLPCSAIGNFVVCFNNLFDESIEDRIEWLKRLHVADHDYSVKDP
jgi:hypothetical protein